MLHVNLQAIRILNSNRLILISRLTRVTINELIEIPDECFIERPYYWEKRSMHGPR